MSLLRLLTTGKSLVGVQETESRYRLTSQRLLPHFGAAKNPFGSSSKSSPAFRGRNSDPAGESTLGKMGERHDVTASKRKPTSIQRERIASVKGIAGSCSTWSARLGQRWAMRIKTLLGRAGAPSTQPVVGRVPKQAVQGELSLDRIKVVRNDLCDADLEVVQMTRSAPDSQLARSQRGAVAEPEQLGWESAGYRSSVAVKS
jgi:hypothetical protein